MPMSPWRAIAPSHGSRLRQRPGVSPVSCRNVLQKCGSQRGFGRAARLVEEPDAALRFVDPVLDQARAGNVAMLVAKIVGSAKRCGQPPVVLTQLGQHVERRYEVRVIVLD